MNARRIIFLLTIIFLFTFTSLPYSGLKSLYAEDPPPEPPPVRCAVIFPFVSYLSGEVTFDTWFSIAGDSTSLEGEETPYVKLYFYDSAGCLIGTKTDGKDETSENSQWTWALSQCGLEVQQLFPGFVVAVTNIPYVEGACFMADPETGATCDAPAIIDYSITGIDANGHIARNAAYTPPQGWDALDPAEGEIDPTLHHTTLIFPFVSYVPDPQGFNTGISITNTFDATGVEDRSVTFYLYRPDGTKAGECTLPLSGEGAVSPMSTFILSEILQPMGAGGFTGAGYIIAHVNIPFAQGYSVVNYSGAIFHSAAGAKVDNNIYAFTDGVPERLNDPPTDHTSIVVPYVTGITGMRTLISLINTDWLLTDANAAFYLYDLSGHLEVSWSVTMEASDCLNGGVYLSVEGEQINIVYPGNYQPIAIPENFEGWLLIIVDTPGAEAMLMMSDTNFNSLSMTRAAVDNDIIGVSEEEGHLGEIIREDPPPADAGDSWSIPFVNTTEGWSSIAVTVNTRNISELNANALVTYRGWTAEGNGGALEPWGTGALALSTLFPCLVQDVSQIDEDGYDTIMGRLRVDTNTSCAHGLAAYVSGADWIFISQAEIRDAKARILVDWDRDDTVEWSEQDDLRKTEPGLVLLKSDTTPVKLGFETVPYGAKFTLRLPQDPWVARVKVNDEYKTGLCEGLDRSAEVTIESSDDSTGRVEIVMECEGATDRLIVWVINSNTGLEIVPALECLPTMPRVQGNPEETITLYAFFNGLPAVVDWLVTNNGSSPPTEVKLKCMIDEQNWTWVDQLSDKYEVEMSTGAVVSTEADDVCVTITKNNPTPPPDTWSDYFCVNGSIDIDVKGWYEDNDEAKEENPGPVVVRNYDNNKAPRKEITLYRLVPDVKKKVILWRSSDGIELYNAMENGTKLTFNAKGEVELDSQDDIPANGKKLYVEGAKPSEKMRDTLLQYKDGNNKDTINFTVLWVTSITGRGTLTPTQKVSKKENNAAYDNIAASYSVQLGVWQHATFEFCIGMELKGTVMPSDFSDNIILDRYMAKRRFKDGVNGSTYWDQGMFDITIIPGDDRSGPLWRDDDPQSGSSKGRGEVYDWRAPGQGYTADAPIGTIVRVRYNMNQCAVYDLEGVGPVRCSQFYKWYCVISGKKRGDVDDWVQETSVTNDNKAVFGSHCNMTSDLGAVTVTAINPNTAPNNVVVNITNLAGTRFAYAAKVTLKKGETEVEATNVVIVSATQITCKFNLNGKPTGQYDVIVKNQGDAGEGKLANGFTVTEPEP